MYIKFFKLFAFEQLPCCILTVVVFCICCTVHSGVSAKQRLYHDLFSVSFPTEKDGWICGRWGTVLNTSDGGKSWVQQNTGTQFTLSSIYFVDPQNGWTVGDQGTIIHTGDGGKTWKQQQSPVSFYLMDVHFVSPLKGWIVTERTNILFTNDGGKTWSVQFSDEDYILKGISFCDSVHGWAVGEYGYTYYTRDGGASWEKQGGFCAIDENTGYLVGGDFLYDVVAVDPQTAWAVGIDGYVIKTVDGGETWQQVDTWAPKTQLFCIASDGA